MLILLVFVGCANNQKDIDALAAKIYSTGNPNSPMPPKPFVSDGCSCWPDSNWVECCVKHDFIYWKGGTRQQRIEADRIFKECVSQKNAAMAAIMYPGVRLGGVWWLPTPFRWGFGWEYPQSGPPGIPY